MKPVEGENPGFNIHYKLKWTEEKFQQQKCVADTQGQSLLLLVSTLQVAQ